MKNNIISIIGTGALGSTLARAFYQSPFTLKSLYNRSPATARDLADELGVRMASDFPEKKEELGTVIFICVPDQHIETTARRLAALATDFSGFTVVHCAGNHPSVLLKSLQNKGASVASFHPLQTFTSFSDANDFKNIYVDIEGDVKTFEFLKQLAQKLESNAIKIDAEAKPYLHAAAVMASNYMVALVEAAGQIAAMGNINQADARKALLPLMQKSIDNIAESSELCDALSGPVARGDISTVAEQLKLLEQNPRLERLYRQLGEVLVHLKAGNALSDQPWKELETLLAGGHEKE